MDEEVLVELEGRLDEQVLVDPDWMDLEVHVDPTD